MSEENLYGGFGADCYQSLLEILNNPTSDDYATLMGILEDVDSNEASLRELLGLLKYDSTFDYWYDSTGRTDMGGDLENLALVGGELITDELGLDCFWQINILLLSTEDHGGF